MPWLQSSQASFWLRPVALPNLPDGHAVQAPLLGSPKRPSEQVSEQLTPQEVPVFNKDSQKDSLAEYSLHRPPPLASQESGGPPTTRDFVGVDVRNKQLRSTVTPPTPMNMSCPETAVFPLNSQFVDVNVPPL